MEQKRKKPLKSENKTEKTELAVQKKDKKKHKKSVDKPVELQSSIGRYMNKE